MKRELDRCVCCGNKVPEGIDEEAVSCHKKSCTLINSWIEPRIIIPIEDKREPYAEFDEGW